MRKTIFEILERNEQSSKFSIAYDVFTFFVIIASLIPIMCIQAKPGFIYIEVITVTIFIIDYILRWITADYKLGKKAWSFVLYPFMPMAIFDILSILSGMSVLSQGFKLFRMTRLFKILRLFKFARHLGRFELLWSVIKKEKDVLYTVMGISIFYIFITALIMFNVEPHINPVTGAVTFSSFFDALYWATVTLTTVGYGDLCPVTDVGRLIGMLSSLFGIAIIALPSGVITASYLDELRKKTASNND